LFQIANDGTNNIVEKINYLTKYDLKKYRYYFSDFSRTEQFYIKNKSNFYQTIKPNKIINFAKFNGFGETIFVTEHLFNSELIHIFDYRNSDEYFSLSQDKLNEINLHKDLLYQYKLILLDQDLKEYEMSHKEIQEYTKNNKICFKNKLVSIILVQGNAFIDSSYDESFLDNFNDYKNFIVIKNLLLSNYPFLDKQSYTKFLRRFIIHNMEEFFSTFYNDKIIINNILLKLDFSKFNILFDHLMFGFDFDSQTSKNVLKNIILNRQEKLLLDTPIILIQLLLSSKSNKLIGFFYNLVSDVELKDERDNNFTKLIVNNLLNTKTIKGIQKHNLKIAMHYINGQYYLKKALEKLNG